MYTKHALLLSSIALASISGSAIADVVLIDFGREDLQSDPNSYNNIYNANQSIGNAIDHNGVFTGMGIDVVDPFFQSGQPSSLGSENPMGDAAQFAASATDDYFFGHTGAFAGEASNPVGIVEFSNLDANRSYSFTIFASRTGVNDNREAQYNMLGGNIGVGSLNASNNESEVLVIEGMLANDDGIITLSAFAGPNNDNGNSFFYLGAIRIDSAPIPAPGAAALLGLAGVFGSRRRRTAI
ncbi:MAG: MYXO-CTERM sorting domain-containing protein [Phycisphaerales bacterium]